MDFRQFIEADLKYRFDNRWDRLKKILEDETNKGTNPNKLWVTFTNVPRLNIYPKTAGRLTKNTPSGIFAYPLEYVVKRRDKIPSFADRAYMLIFRSKDEIYDIGSQRSADKDRHIHNFFMDYLKKHIDDFSIWKEDIMSMMHNWIGDEKFTTINVKERIFSDIGYLIQTHIDDTVFTNTNIQRLGTQVYEQDPEAVWNFTVTDDVRDIIEHDDKFEKYIPYIKEFDNGKMDRFKEFHESIREQKVGHRLEINIIRALRADELDEIYKRLREVVLKVEDFVKKIPNGENIIKTLEDYNINLINAVGAVHNRVTTMDELPYLLLRAAAEKLGTETQGKWPVKWNVLLRKSGFTNIADLQGTGAIHGAEPEQAVFLDMSKVEPISVIPNKSHIDPIMGTGDYYATRDFKHDHTPAKEQRQSRGFLSADRKLVGIQDKKYYLLEANIRYLYHQLRMLLASSDEKGLLQMPKQTLIKLEFLVNKLLRYFHTLFEGPDSGYREDALNALSRNSRYISNLIQKQQSDIVKIVNQRKIIKLLDYLDYVGEQIEEF